MKQFFATAALGLAITTGTGACQRHDTALTPANFNAAISDNKGIKVTDAEVRVEGFSGEGFFFGGSPAPVYRNYKSVSDLKECFSLAYQAVKFDQAKQATASCFIGKQVIMSFDCGANDRSLDGRDVSVGCTPKSL